MRNNTKKILLIVVLFSIFLSATAVEAIQDKNVQVDLVTRNKKIILADGYKFKDLNANGLLDPYEDWRLSPEERTEDLISRMSLEQKACQMVHLTLVHKKDEWFSENNVGFALVYEYIFSDAQTAAKMTNELQELSESSELGIPIILSMDTEIGNAFVRTGTYFPDQINQGAANDADLVFKLNDILRRELLAVGVRMALSPDADLITDPRWGRNQECYSEDVETVKKLISSAVKALQCGSELNNDSVIAVVKHFPGSGAQKNGVDGSPLTIQEDSLNLHLSGFKSAIDAGVAAVMPYGYSTVPFLGGDAAEVSADQSQTVITDLLRGKLEYDGIVQTDWGLNFVGAANAGADILGGAGVRSTRSLVKDVDEKILDEACRKILNAKFALGIFENPYVDEEEASEIVGNNEHKDIAKLAAEKSFTLVKHESTSALNNKGFVVAGELANDNRCLNSGWTAKEPELLQGQSILEALREKAGDSNIKYLPTSTDIPENLSGITAVAVLGEKSGTHDPQWGAETLEFPQEQQDLVNNLKKSGANVISVVVMNRPYILKPIVDLSESVLIVYRPGVTCGASAVADCLFGETAINGKLPFQIPLNKEQVINQREDLPLDIENPLFDYGFGIETEAFGKK